MKYIRIFLLSLVFLPFAARGAGNDFMVAAQLLSAAKNANIQQVQALVNSGADVNYVDATGLSLVCTALMNKDYRAAQILQMYGADASKCDQQIKQYNSRTKPKQESGGLFGGLSSAQSLMLAAAGAAVVIGGVLWLSGVFDSGNHNGSGGSSGSRPNGGGSDDGSGNGASTAWFASLPYGPAMPDADSEQKNFTQNLNYYSPGDDSQIALNFAAMTNGTSAAPGQNYLLMMRGYAPLARGYMGMQTLRLTTNAPLDMGNVLTGYKYKLFNTEPVMGGKPVNVALVTANGINAAQNTSLQNKYIPWLALSGENTVGGASAGAVSSKYYNNDVSYNGSETWGTDGSDAFSVSEAASVMGATFDLSGAGTAINNPFASDLDNMLAKVVGGSDAGYSNSGDFMGFMPNGQMTIFRTGNGWGYSAPTSALNGSYSLANDTSLAAGDTITINGVTYTISAVNSTGTQFTATTSGTSGTITASGLIAGGSLYLDADGDGRIDQVFSINSADKTLAQILQGHAIDYMNYQALVGAASLIANPSPDARRSAPSIIANASVIDPLRNRFGSGTTAATLNDMMATIGTPNVSSQQIWAQFREYVNNAYDNTPDDDDLTSVTPGDYALVFFKWLDGTLSAGSPELGSSGIRPLVIFSTGSFETAQGWTGAALDATFENAAPLVFSGIEHLFMSVVAVGMSSPGTNDVTSVSGFSPAGKYKLAQWSEGTGDNMAYFRARKCGIAGRGANGIDPWCFAAAGLTDELAVASAAGAAGALYSAFGGENGYLSNRELFVLMALTADGPYLGTDAAGNKFTKDGLIAYLQDLYELPGEDALRVQNGENYLDVFKEVFGYGLINLDRATTPGTTVYYYTGKDIVSANGNAFARAAANTTFRPSAAFNPRAATISAPFFDVLESIDGELSLPRVWRNEFSLGTNTARGLYMGDTLGELKTRNIAAPRTQIGAMGFTLTSSAKQYADYMGGLDAMTLDYAVGDWNLRAGYQRYFTDGKSRFDGMTNPILALASNAVVTDADYNFGRVSIGARAFSGIISDEGILENDPTISAQFMPAELGQIRGAQSHVAWRGEHFDITTAFGAARETQTLLGAQTGGLLALGAGDTMYVDSVMRYAPTDALSFTLRGTFARTTSNAAGDFILGMSDIDSDAYAFGVDAGNFSFAVSRPLGVRRGALRHSYADYRVQENADGNFELNVADLHIENLNLAPENRELRFSGTYRHNFGAFTDGALGFIYRVHPNNTDEFGNESIFMMKLTHRVGI